MKDITILLFSILIALPVAAAHGQERCTAEALAKKPGLLRASRLSGSTGGMFAADVARARATLAKIHQTIAAGYSPAGVVGEYSYRFSGGAAAGTFGYSLYLLKYNCDKTSPDPTKFYIGTDTPTVVRIDANVIHALDLSAADTTDNSFRGYLVTRVLPKKVDDIYFLGDNPGGGTKENQKEYTWLVTYDDQLPFTTVSRKEYLALTKQRLEKTIRESGDSSRFYDQYVNRINDELRKSESELSQPAIVNRLDEERFTGFLREGSRGAVYAIRHDPAYYRKGLPRSAAQFFTVTYSVYEGDPVYPDNIKAIQNALDLNLLKGLLGK